jgi:DNA-binding transcriptional MerR regulator
VKIGQAAKRLSQSPNTIRYWVNEYGSYLSSSAQVKGLGTARNLTERDLLILATIADLRSQGLNRDQIEKAIVEGKLVAHLPETPTPETEAAQKSITLVPIADLHRTLDQIKTLQTEIDRLVTERDNAVTTQQDMAEAYTERIEELSRELGRARGMLVGGIVALVLIIIVAVAIFILLIRYLPAPG